MTENTMIFAGLGFVPDLGQSELAEKFLKLHPNCGIDKTTMVIWFTNMAEKGYSYRDSEIRESE